MRSYDLLYRRSTSARSINLPYLSSLCALVSKCGLYAGITGGYGGDRRVEYIIPHEARAAGRHDFIIESSCNGMFGVPLGDAMGPPDVSSLFNTNLVSIIED